MASFTTTVDISSVAGMIQYLCENTSLTNCSEISKKLSATVKNSERLAEYTKSVKEHGELTNRAIYDTNNLLKTDLQKGLDAVLYDMIGERKRVVGDYLTRTKDLISKKKTMEEYLEQDDILKDLKKIDNTDDFEVVIESLINKVDTSWWSCGISWLTKVFNYWKKTIAAFVEWLKEPKKLTVILFVLWLLLCEYNKYKQNEQLSISGQCKVSEFEEIELPDEPPSDILSTSCAKTNDMLNLLSVYAQYTWRIIKNALLSLFGMNAEYIIPLNINPLANVEQWDYSLSKAFSEVGYTVGCTVVSATSGVTAQIASVLSVAAPASLMVTGAISLTFGLICYSASNLTNRTIIKPIISQEYLALERTILRPYLMILWDKIFNEAIKVFNMQGPWADRFNIFAKSIMDIMNTFQSIQTALMSNIKNKYLSGANVALNLSMSKFHLESWVNENRKRQNKDLEPANIEKNYMGRRAQQLPILTLESFDNLSSEQQMQIMVILRNLGQIDDLIWKNQKKKVKEFYFGKSGSGSTSTNTEYMLKF